MRVTLFILFLFLTNFVIGQNQVFEINQIDSMVISIDSNKQSRTSIACGIFKPKEKGESYGSFSDTYYLHPTNLDLIKVDGTEFRLTQDFTSYYFFNSKLIFVKTTHQNLSGTEEILNGRYYFNNGQLTHKIEIGSVLKRPELFLNDASHYLKVFKSMFNLK